MNYKNIQKTIGGLLLCASAPLQSQAAQEQPNILFLIVDDLRPELGCYGEKHILTPNIDALAKDATVFTHCYVQYAVSDASRASFLTGCRPASTGVGYPYSEYFVNEFLPSHPSIQTHMYRNGYYTRTLGKVHHGLGEDLTEKHFSSGQKSSYLSKENIAIEKSGQKRERALTEFLDLPDTAYIDGKTAQETVKTIERAVKSKKPFFIAAGFLKPHLPFVAPLKYLNMYPLSNVPPSPFPYPTKNETPYSRSFYNVNEFKGGQNGPDSPLSESLSQKLRQAYFACVTFTDAQIGLIIDKLKEEGIYDNTAIILIGDHGWHLGDNAMWGKQANFERTTRAPFIVKAPKGKEKQVSKNDALTEFVDIYPTICEFASVPTPSFVEGTSVIPLLYNDKLEWKSAAFSEHPRGGMPEGTVNGYTIRTPRYRYVEWRKGDQIKGQELYDHSQDPLETTNIAAENKELCQELSEKMRQGWKAALPEGVENHSNNPKAPKSPGWGPEAQKKKKTTAIEPIEELMDEASLTTITLNF